MPPEALSARPYRASAPRCRETTALRSRSGGTPATRRRSRDWFSRRQQITARSDATARPRVTAGRWTLDVSVRQESPEKYRKRFIRVLSVTEVGSLGTNNPAAASGLPLRKILDNAKNFSPTGTVIVGGFSFSEASRTEMQATSAGSGSDIYRNVRNTISTQDVIYLTYNTLLSDDLAQVVLAWLQGSPNRVFDRRHRTPKRPMRACAST